MPRFASPQVHPFLEVLVESPIAVRATHNGERLEFVVEDPTYEFLGALLSEGAPTLTPAPPEDLVLWRALLDYGPEESVEDFVTAPGSLRPFPREVLEDWTRNASYAYEDWRRSRDSYEPWLAQVAALESELPPPADWSAEPPGEEALRGLEYDLSQPLPSRSKVLRRLFGLGLFEPEDEGRCRSRLEALGLEALAAWREASLLHRWVSQFVDGMWPGASQLASPVSVEWFLAGPFHQHHLDPLSHLKFGLQTHLARTPPEEDSCVVISMGGRFSGAFHHQLGPGGVAQLVGSGEPVPSSALAPGYPRTETPGGQRCAELGARATRRGQPRLGAWLALRWLQSEPEHGQSWIELGVALADLGHVGWGRTCLDRAEAAGLRFSRRGELAAVAASTPEPLPDESEAIETTLSATLAGWEEELSELEGEELTALCLCDEVLELPGLRTALEARALPPVLRRRVSRVS